MEKKFSTIDIYAWLVQMADGLASLAERGFFHRDLAARNILLCADMHVKIGDFGHSKKVHEDYKYTESSLVT